LADTAHGAESVRLAALEADRDPGTIRRLDMLDVRPGLRCLEVGAGRGSIARWLSARVGPDGRVVAADIDCRFLTALPDNVEVRTLDIRHEGVEPDTYDVVHCRALLMHLPDPAAALGRMVAALRPGGVLLAEEGDYGLVSYAGHPDARWCTDLFRRQLEAITSAGIMNGFLGRTLPALLLDAGLELIGGDVHTSIARPGDSAFEFHRLTVEGSAPTLIAAGLMTESDLERVLGVLGSPSVVVTSATTVAVSGRRTS
jgi:2-polyprenyl-3-methyl-5-hydroxy-6-metoxy-1,4-benzoquinol methylase